MNNLPENLASIRARIDAAARAAGRSPDEVTLIGVSKRQPAEAIRTLFAAGQRAFGENYLQEALDKQTALADLPIEWHFIGPIQSNKTRSIAESFDWVHSVDRLKIAQRLSEQRPTDRAPLNVCLQVNIDAEASKSGVDPDTLEALASQVADLPRLALRGLMAIPAPRADYADQLAAFSQLQRLIERLRAKRGLQSLDTLSMGMSGDLEAAIAAGATMVRIGTDLFGARGV
ncbi:YggS family pyridoxal phosphate-dependent enzyme [Proteobacteria bacterium 005FR1]|nr:YggS family pyridoxal phosphate-dependent enzyme [Proteobacteria bacterium 005FR1]